MLDTVRRREKQVDKHVVETNIGVSSYENVTRTVTILTW